MYAPSIPFKQNNVLFYLSLRLQTSPEKSVHVLDAWVMVPQADPALTTTGAEQEEV
jgi:hypothetical protein